MVLSKGLVKINFLDTIKNNYILFLDINKVFKYKIADN